MFTIYVQYLTQPHVDQTIIYRDFPTSLVKETQWADIIK